MTSAAAAAKTKKKQQQQFGTSLSFTVLRQETTQHNVRKEPRYREDN